MTRELTVGSIWKHYKRNSTYTILGVAKSQIDENESDMVVYKARDDKQLWVRPLNRFLEKVDKDTYRFERIS
jgi:hypothetical protein